MSLSRKSRLAAETGDRRALKSREAVIGAFNRLVLEHGYDGINARDIADAANVGRSTFYKHFGSKRDVFRDSLPPRLAPLADLPFTEELHPAVANTLEHFWENRRIGRFILNGEFADEMTSVLGEMIAERLGRGRASKLIVAGETVAMYAAHGMMGVIHDWLEARKHYEPEQLARILHKMSRASILSASHDQQSC